MNRSVDTPEPGCLLLQKVTLKAVVLNSLTADLSKINSAINLKNKRKVVIICPHFPLWSERHKRRRKIIKKETEGKMHKLKKKRRKGNQKFQKNRKEYLFSVPLVEEKKERKRKKET